MNTEGDRLRYYIESKSFTIMGFCKASGMIYTSFHPILQDSRPLGMNILKKVIEFFPNLNVNWLLTGLGNVEIDPNEEGALQEPKPIYGKVDPGHEAFLKYFDEEITQNKIYGMIEKKLKEYVKK
jgi:hypothetical protein